MIPTTEPGFDHRPSGTGDPRVSLPDCLDGEPPRDPAMTRPLRLPVGAQGSRNIYVASSWRNQRHQSVVELLRSHGHRVYDFKRPDNTCGRGFRWSDANLLHSNPVDRDPRAVDLADAGDYVAALSHPAARHAFDRDFGAMLGADTFVLVLPCGRSAHLELGWSAGAGKPTAVLLDDPCTPELMYRMIDLVTTRLDELVDWLAHPVKDAAATSPWHSGGWSH